MDCISFVVWLASGAFVVPLLQWLKRLPTVGAFVEQWAWILAPLLAAVAPVIADVLKPYCSVLDQKLSVLLYAALVYLVSQIAYWVSKKVGALK